MPVGGDVTQFQIGLMAVMGRALRSGRLPLWNDLWGYGFPGVGESQMGAFYPPHVLLYRMFPVELAYTVSLVAHTIWGALGAYWLARKVGASPWGASLGAWAWSGSGFFLIHLAHQWGYTTACWMPWAWGLGWATLRGERRGRSAWLLAAVLALQTLPGHFQIAFQTQVGLVVLGICHGFEGRADRRRGLLALLAALAAVLPLAAMQLWPTARLARLAEDQRDFEYLSGFAATPFHLIGYVAPGLFHRSQLWRPVAWDPFHTSPEEYLAYLGLVPIFLAVVAILHGRRRDPATRALTALAVVATLLSLGPYLPGFAWLIRLPGFSFFRSPARWSVASGLALAMLAAKGLDAIAIRPRPGRALARFVGLAIGVILAVLGLFELALASTDGAGMPAVARAFESARRLSPWPDDLPFRAIMEEARRARPIRGPGRDLLDDRIEMAQAREQLGPIPTAGIRLHEQRFFIYAHELSDTTLILVGLLALASVARRGKAFRTGLIVATALDLGLLGRHRLIDSGPIAPLAEQSVVLGRLANAPRGTRVVAPIGNLPMVAGAAPIEYFRTLDLPVLRELTKRAEQPPVEPRLAYGVPQALRAAGADVQIARTTGREYHKVRGVEVVDDPALAGWMWGSAWVATRPDLARFVLWRPGLPTSRAWLLPPGDLPRTESETVAVERIRRSSPLPCTTIDPENLEVTVVADRPCWVLVTQLDDGDWRAEWRGEGRSSPAPIETVFGGWQAVRLPEPGHWTLRLSYRGRAVWQGLAVSALAWACWVVFGVVLWRRRLGDEEHAKETLTPALSREERGEEEEAR
ncbi:MAG TPA: hypothetical protein VG406_18335 [Isosphaeraceae bacterium]|jgi:hypothetical protein|nr:hypothetical protein [Isosphaeraceae bacterium]